MYTAPPMASLAIFLARHGEAEPSGFAPDAQRALTEEGRRHLRAVGRLLADDPDAIDLVVTSPLVRAVQTAEILVGELHLDGPVRAEAEIAHPGSLEALTALATEVPGHVRGVLVVGHEPTMGVWAQSLLGPAGPQVSFRTGTVLGLRWDRDTRRAVGQSVYVGRPPARVSL